jgi:hypothetical protein
MNILPQIKEKIIQEILLFVKAKWHPAMRLGVFAFSLRPFVSINANARMARENSAASERQVYRMLEKVGLLDSCVSLLLSWLRIDDNSLISVDFTIMNPYAVLCFALQTRTGRSIPVWVDVIRYPIEGSDDSQNLFILDSLREFVSLIGCTPKFVFDRGFMGEPLVHGYLDLEITFYLRIKAGTHWMVRDRQTQKIKKKRIGGQWKLDEVGEIYGENLRIIRSSYTQKREHQADECWFILTNDKETKREEILEYYYYRFEIEETFKDVKHVLAMKPRYFKKTQTLKTILWFQMLGFWILWKVKGHTLQLKLVKCIKKKISWFKEMFEQLTKEASRLTMKDPYLLKYG